MKVHKIELVFLDFQNFGPQGLIDEISNTDFIVIPGDIKTVDIGEWNDDNPLNKEDTAKAEIARLFPPTDQIKEERERCMKEVCCYCKTNQPLATWEDIALFGGDDNDPPIYPHQFEASPYYHVCYEARVIHRCDAWAIRAMKD